MVNDDDAEVEDGDSKDNDSDDSPDPPEKPMRDPATTLWELPISDTDYEKLMKGFSPQSLDDKWSIYAVDLDDGRTTKVTIGRGWRWYRHYLLHVTRRSDDSGWMIESMTWEQNKGDVIFISEEQGKKEAIILCRIILKCEIEAFPQYEVSVFGCHGIVL